MHQIEPYHLWNKYYDSSKDERSPFFGKEYNYEQYNDTIYGFYINPGWDFIGSETLYLKLLYVDYTSGSVIIELMGEWNDTLHNDVMHMKRNIIDILIYEGIKRFILIGENVYNFHGSDDCYYEEWFEEIENGWISGVNFPEQVTSEWAVYNVDSYINYGGDLNIANWRTRKPTNLITFVDQIVNHRISLV